MTLRVNYSCLGAVLISALMSDPDQTDKTPWRGPCIHFVEPSGIETVECIIDCVD